MEDYRKHRFRELSARAQKSAVTLMQYAMDDPEGHEVRVAPSGNKAKPYSYQVALSTKQLHGPVVEDAADLVQLLVMNLEMGDIVDHDWKRFRFRPESLAFYRELHPLTEHERRVIIGRYFQKLGTGGDAMIPFNAEKLSTELMLSAEEITETVRSLSNAGYLHNVGPRGSKIPPYYQMTQLGFQWALSGFRADMLLTPTVTVNLRVEMNQVIEVVANLDVPEEQRKFYEYTAMKLQRELEDEKLSWSTLKDTLEMAANTQAVAPSIISLIANHKDQILQALQQVL